MLTDGRRVIECAADIQWVIQVHKGRPLNPWEGRSFCRTKEALIRLAGADPHLGRLPDRYPDGRQGLSRPAEAVFESASVHSPIPVPKILSSVEAA
jgi:hypothetical protein